MADENSNKQVIEGVRIEGDNIVIKASEDFDIEKIHKLFKERVPDGKIADGITIDKQTGDLVIPALNQEQGKNPEVIRAYLPLIGGAAVSLGAEVNPAKFKEFSQEIIANSQKPATVAPPTQAGAKQAEVLAEATPATDNTVLAQGNDVELASLPKREPEAQATTAPPQEQTQTTTASVNPAPAEKEQTAADVQAQADAQTASAEKENAKSTRNMQVQELFESLQEMISMVLGMFENMMSGQNFNMADKEQEPAPKTATAQAMENPQLSEPIAKKLENDLNQLALKNPTLEGYKEAVNDYMKNELPNTQINEYKLNESGVLEPTGNTISIKEAGYDISPMQQQVEAGLNEFTPEQYDKSRKNLAGASPENTAIAQKADKEYAHEQEVESKKMDVQKLEDRPAPELQAEARELPEIEIKHTKEAEKSVAKVAKRHEKNERKAQRQEDRFERKNPEEYAERQNLQEVAPLEKQDITKLRVQSQANSRPPAVMALVAKMDGEVANFSETDKQKLSMEGATMADAGAQTTGFIKDGSNVNPRSTAVDKSREVEQGRLG